MSDDRLKLLLGATFGAGVLVALVISMFHRIPSENAQEFEGLETILAGMVGGFVGYAYGVSQKK